MKKTFFLAYGFIAYLSFLAALVSAIGLGANLLLPESSGSFAPAALMKNISIDILLIAVVGIQVYVSVQLVIKKQMTVHIPEVLERSTMVLLVSSGVLVAAWLWQPLGGIVWTLETGMMKYLLLFFYFLGWSLVIISTFLIYHADLFGLKQVWSYYAGEVYRHPGLMKPVFIRFARHPLYFGFLVACWCVPVMTVTHILFSIMYSGYVILVMRNMEYDLVFWVEKSGSYRKQAPLMQPF